MDRPIARPRWRREGIIGTGIAAAVVISLISILVSEPARSIRMPLKNVSIAEVTRSQMKDFIPLRSIVVPKDVVYLDAQEGGRVERVLAQAGDFVTAGQALIEFGNTDLQLQVIEREARLIEQINNLRSIEMELAQKQVDNARSMDEINYNITRLARMADRVNALAERGATAPEERERVLDELKYYNQLRPLVEAGNKTQEELRRQRIPEMKDALAKLRQNLEVVRSKLDGLIVRAPATGRLTELDLKVGQNCDRGQRLAEITPDSGFVLRSELDEFYLSRTRPGQQAQLDIGAGQVAVTVARVYPQVKDGRFRIDLAFGSTQPEDLLAGQSMQGRLQLGEARTATIIPNGPFVETTGGDWLFVVSADGQSAQRRRIKIGQRNADQLQILEGLNPGESVIISGYKGLDRIDRVEFTE